MKSVRSLQMSLSARLFFSWEVRVNCNFIFFILVTSFFYYPTPFEFLLLLIDHVQVHVMDLTKLPGLHPLSPLHTRTQKPEGHTPRGESLLWAIQVVWPPRVGFSAILVTNRVSILVINDQSQGAQGDLKLFTFIHLFNFWYQNLKFCIQNSLF